MTMQGLTPQLRPELNWTLLARKFWTTTPYSPDLATSDFHLFRHLKHHLGGNHYNDDVEVKTAVTSWLLEQAASFYEEDIQNLVVRVLASILMRRGFDTQISRMFGPYPHRILGEPNVLQVMWLRRLGRDMPAKVPKVATVQCYETSLFSLTQRR
ncbi:hypothetical protein AVEN_89093-1 [Araneus ventricosus]|uniref:Uncharacterized protein n=1 Tax=Araneus ventricosus TaxID=182803 RepID=A0A4Y2B232_ARAVE|nr:hypothetical protein AVEN_89093-1 [Araneus ventricosus]